MMSQNTCAKSAHVITSPSESGLLRSNAPFYLFTVAQRCLVWFDPLKKFPRGSFKSSLLTRIDLSKRSTCIEPTGLFGYPILHVSQGVWPFWRPQVRALWLVTRREKPVCLRESIMWVKATSLRSISFNFPNWWLHHGSISSDFSKGLSATITLLGRQKSWFWNVCVAARLELRMSD